MSPISYSKEAVLLAMDTKELQNMITGWDRGNDKPFQLFYQKLYDKTFITIKKLTQSTIEAEKIFKEIIPLKEPDKDHNQLI
jgi:hypothetical protein